MIYIMSNDIRYTNNTSTYKLLKNYLTLMNYNECYWN